MIFKLSSEKLTQYAWRGAKRKHLAKTPYAVLTGVPNLLSKQDD